MILIRVVLYLLPLLFARHMRSSCKYSFPRQAYRVFVDLDFALDLRHEMAGSGRRKAKVPECQECGVASGVSRMIGSGSEVAEL